MAQCAVFALLDGVSTPVLIASDADPCTSVVLLTPSEYAAWSASPLNLSAEDGLLLSVAILGVWGSAYAWRALARALNVDGHSTEET